VLVLLTGVMYEVRLHMVSSGMMYIPGFMKSGTYVQAVLRSCLIKLRGCAVDITDEKGIYEVRHRDRIRCHDIHSKFLMTG
jgi:hypothetical protein